MTPDSLQWITRRASWAMLGLHLAVVVLPLVLVTTGGAADHSARQIAFAVPALTVFAILHLRHVRAAARGSRPRGWPWSLIALAALAYLPLNWIGGDWAATGLLLTASAMLLLPGHWRFSVGFAVPFAIGTAWNILLAFGYLGADQGDPSGSNDNEVVVAVYWVGIQCVFIFALYGVVRLVVLVNELYETRSELAQSAVDRERIRLSRDLHDLLGQSLSAISLKGDLAIRLLPIDPAGARTEIVSLTEVARTALRDVRAITRDEHQVTLRDEIAAAAALLAAAGVDARIEDGGYELPSPVERVLAWAVREGTTNLLRHSDASYCVIKLTLVDGQVSLEMVNDGVRSAVSADGSGIAGLHERAAALGGHVSTQTAGNTFRLSVSLEVR
ncbi:two-component system sensor histidine kinase DesK [Kribbella voronezhensis]|uniref:Two-component system sensor histidine kinase DesK n=1 Tax=Kribbella voronezhensis TaxID=2512212 RepID=A0A4R7TEX8_9ACTN|nr:histidine kinase [Kribbella voronezhensis]TDU90740.1 two-component system sensor histidine kinase DesK [Kribbella voronezhensis]